MKNTLIILSLFISSTVFAQDSGTFKVIKKEKEQEEVELIKYNRFSLGLESVFAGKSSPERVRDMKLSFGYFIHSDAHAPITIGISAGQSHPNINYKGTTLGCFAGINPTLLLGPGNTSFPLEISYNKLFNTLEQPNLNQYSAGLGLGFNPFLFIGIITRSYNKSFQLTFLGKYHYDTNSIDTFKGVHPTLRINYNF